MFKDVDFGWLVCQTTEIFQLKADCFLASAAVESTNASIQSPVTLSRNVLPLV
jgi:hypothetical protein